MASSRQMSSNLQRFDDRYLPAGTPGPLGLNDRADPNVTACFGDTPGPVGVNDSADPDLRSAAVSGKRTYSVLLLDHARVASFLASVAYLQVAAETITTEKGGIGLWFSSDEVVTGNEITKARLLDAKKAVLMDRFADACSHGSIAAIAFLRDQERSREAARAHVQEVFRDASQSNQATTESLQRWVAVLKTVEYGAAITLSVAGLFVTSATTLAAGVIGFSYDTATKVIDHLGEASTVNADVLALISRDVAADSSASAGKELAQTVLAGKELHDIEKLRKSVSHLHEKIAVKETMIRETSSQHNAARLARSIRKNEAAIAEDLKQIRRFEAVTLLFVAWDVKDNVKKIIEAWTHK